MGPSPSLPRPAERSPKRPYTILFAPASNVLFHVGRCVMVAREMARRGHRTMLVGTDRYLRDPEVVATAESAYLALPDFSPEEGMDLLRSIRKLPERRVIEELVEAEVAALRALRPDLVVVDFRPTMALSARECGIPIASLLLGHWMPAYARDPGWVPRTYPIGVALVRAFGERVARRLAAPTFRQVIRYKTAPFRAVARARGQAAPPLLWELLQGDLNLLTDPEALCPISLPEGCHRVGPVLWEPEMPVPAWASRLDQTRPVLFVNFGSTGHPDLFRATFAEFANRRYQVMLATCGQIEARDFDVPPNFHVAKFLPVAKMVQLSDLVVYHGGAGTFQQAIRAGVPGVVIATHWDQEHAGVVSRELGLGLFLTMREVLSSPGRLRRAVDELIDSLPSYQERARRAKHALLRYDGPKAAAELLEAFLDARSGLTRPGRRGDRSPGPTR